MAGYIDARSAELPDVIDASVCVVGAGAAGLTLARTLAETTPGVVLVESGAFELEGDTQNLFSGKSVGIPYFNLTACRLRYFGGTTNHWAGNCRPNDPIDYEGRAALGLPKWPISHDDLEPYIVEAAHSLGISGKFFDLEMFADRLGVTLDDLVDAKSTVLESKIGQQAKDIRLGRKYREAMGRMPNLTTYLHLNLTHIQLTENGAEVAHFECATLNGKKVRIRARAFALCCHAIENARMLLISNDVVKPGVGNETGHVGRYFMDHTHIFASRFIPSPSFPYFYDRYYGETRNLTTKFAFRDDFLRQEGLLQYYCRFNPVYYDSDVGMSLQNVRMGVMQPGDMEFLQDVGTVLFNLDSIARARMSVRQNSFYQPLPPYYLLEHRLEQAPNPDSRVVISDQLDALGSPIADLDWQLNDVDFDSFRRCQDLLAQELARLGYGRAELEDITPDLVRSRVSGHYHQIGTTRMSDQPADGVVDRDCKVHSVSNLYVGGSSTFPTSGFSGPTMMIIGFALRLADTIRDRVAA